MPIFSPRGVWATWKGESMDLLSLVGQAGSVVRREARTHGGEWAGSCPSCGGKDRFLVWPNQDNGKGIPGRWWCRGCGKSGDTIGFLMSFRGLTYPDACKALGIEPGEAPRKSPSLARRTERAAWAPRAIEPRPDAWREKARSFVEWAAGNLEGDHGRDTMAYLEGRGLTRETIRANRLGWNPRGLFRDREAWGLPPEPREDGKPRRLWLPAGIVIPVFSPDEKLSGVKIRRPDADIESDRQKGNGREKIRYYALPGSAGACMVLLGGPAAVVVEAELDAILVHQEARELASGISLGSASNRPDTAAMEALGLAESVLISLDADRAGAEQFWAWWTEHFPKARRWPPVRGKDPGDMARKGLSIRDWIMAGIRVGTVNQGRLNKTDKDRK